MSSSLGQEFYLGFMQNIGGGQFSSLRLLIGTDTQFASYVVETVDQIVQQGSVSSGTPVSVHISGLDLEVFTSNYDNRWKGIRVASNEDIFVVAENFILAINHGVFLAYPRFTFEQEVDYEYYIVSIEDITDFAHSQLLLVGCENETTITILPSQNVILPTNLQESSTSILVNAGTTSHTMVLNQLQTLLVSSFDDLTGTKIVSDKPLTVIGGHECAVNPASSSACEPLAVQIPSSLLWGRQFLLAPFTGRGSEQYFKLFSSIPTTVNYTCGNSSFSFNNVTNRIFGTYEYCYLESINPLLVAQVSTGSSIDFSGDLAIALISPIDNYVRETSFVSLPSYLFSLNYISVTVAIENFNSSCIMFDDQVIDCDWNEILNTEMQVVGYGCSKAVNSGSTVGTQHTVYHDNGTLSVLVYGFNGGPSLGYAYLTGQTLTEKQVTPISPPENVTAIVSSSTEICVTWAEVPVIGRIGVITSYEVMYEPLMTLDGQLVSVSLDTTGFFLSLNSLQEYIEYNISVRAYTSVGPGPYSLGIVRRTLEDVPYSSPRNIDAISTSSTVIHVSWIKVNEIDQNGVITMYEVVYLGEFDLTNRSVFTLDGDTLTVNITGVEEFAEYNISVRAYTSVGPGPYSQVQMELTMEDVPVSPPQNIRTTALSSTEIEVSWDSIPEIDRNGVINMYEVLYEPLMTLGGLLTTATLNTTDLFLILNSLQEYVEYNISVRAYTSVGPGPYSLGIVRRTLEDVPYSSPRNVDAISTSSTVIHVSWIKVNEIDQNGVITMYEVVYLGEFDLTNRSVFTLDGDTVTVNITGVEEFAEYNISVRAYTSVGPGPYSQVQTDLTMEDVPVSPPQNIRTTALSSTEIEISWDKIPEIDQNGVISMYEVMYVMTFGGLITTRTIITIDLTLTINLSNLEEFVEYNISVRAYTSIGSGPYSVWTVRRTLEDVPSSAPRNILVSAVEPSSLYVSWERPLEIDVNGILTNYTIEHRTLNHTGDPLVVPSTTLNVLLEGLRFFTVYNVSISANTAVGKGPSVQMSQRTLVRTCPQDSSSGFLWASITEGSVLSLPCTQASSQFRPGTYATRMCLLGGTWSEVDLTSCTLDSMDSNPFMLVYLDLQEPSRRKKRSIENLLLEPMELRRKVRAATSNNSQLLLMELETIFSSLNITTEAIRVLHLAQTAEGLSIAFEIVLPKESESLPPVFVDYFNNEIQTNGLAGYSVSSGGLSGIIGVGPTETCECGTTAGGNTSIITSLQLCTGLSLSPCSCETGGCECQEPYVGDGRHCTLDSDGDLFPDVALNISSCTEENSYCVQDVCPSVSNVNQDPSDCTSTMDPGFDGCPFEEDPVWSIEWPNTERNTISTQRCPGDLDNVIGNATRLCDDNGVWLSTIVETCEDERFVEVVNQAEELFSSDANMTELVEEAIVITQTLVIITDQTSILLPSSLSSTTTIVTNILDVFEEAQNISTIASNTVIREGMLLVEIINNVLEVNNTAGWTELSETDSSSEVLLDNAERLGVLLANSQNNTGSNEPLRISRPNIAITASTFDTSREATIEELTLPKQEDVVNLSLTIQPAQIQIPPNLLLERLSEEGNRSIPVVFIWFQNLEDFLSTSVDNLGNNTRGASSVVSIQVGRARSTTTSAVLLNSPVQLNFSFENINKSQEYRCAFWNFSQSGEGQWSSQNVFTIGNISANLTTTVQCVSTHLTSFAVLVDVAGGLKNIHLDESIGLDVVSYIGCVFSILCLSVTVVFYLYQGKKLFKAVHFFVHLNLSISLLLAYTIFIIGIQTAAASTVGCIFIAAILHYLFLSAFCWMMCEGVMLYLMLVTVFSQVSKAWWFFLLLGYATPLPFVVITISVRWEQYGVRNDDGDLEFCWLSTDNGTIFGFVAPMMLIIVINVLFLILTLRALWKSQKNKLERQLHGNVKDSKIRISIIKSVLFAVVILLPLLGLTWVFGLLTINSNTSVFAWIFTILNSLQGLGVLFFHVIRSDAVWSRIMSTLNNCRGKITTTSDPKLTTDTAKTPKSSWTDSKNVGRQTSQVKLTKNKLLEDVGPIFESKSEEGHLFAVKNAYGVDEAFNPFELEDLMAFEERSNLDLDHISFNNEQF
ncbi:uncharacterized protein LOC135333251 isoform X3 [Halichondria panicea]